MTKIAGVYAISTTTYSWTNVQPRVAIYVEPADGSPAMHLCEAHAPNGQYSHCTVYIRREQVISLDKITLMLSFEILFNKECHLTEGTRNWFVQHDPLQVLF